MNDVVIRGVGICKSYYQDGYKLDVLRGIDLDVKRGEVVAITGPSGVGKSTLLHILGALDRATAGKVEIEETDISTLSDRELAKLRNMRIGFVFQFHHLLPEFTALENVMMPLLIARMSPEKAAESARELLDAVGLSDRAVHRPGELSGGEMQRVAVARALIRRPTVVLADEPSGNLDLANSEILHNLIWRLAETFEQTFVIATHDPDLANKAHRMIKLANGCVVAEDDMNTSGNVTL